MLNELHVSNLGVIEQVSLDLTSGMIALTGETGAGKTLLVDAINLLVGGRAEPALVRPGETEATVDGRFEVEGQELILSRVIPVEGRSRAYINNRPATAAALAELGEKLVDLHGQHAHQSLLAVEAQRASLDTFGSIDLAPLALAQERLREIEVALAALGGDERSRARELDLLRYQVEELDNSDLHDADEDTELETAEELLANAVEYQLSGATALGELTDDDGVRDVVAKVLNHIQNHRLFAAVNDRLKAILADLDDVSDSLRSLVEEIEPDPTALERVQSRRRVLHDLCRKYGDNLAQVIDERERLRANLTELETHEERAAKLDTERAAALVQLAEAQAEVLAARIGAAPRLAAEIENRLPDLAMPKARFEILVDGVDGSDVSFNLAANPGSTPKPLVKVASGGELARTMLALRNVLSEAPPILVFDEVDAGIGGKAGLAVGKSLANLGHHHQVFVVTHLPGVAAFADHHLVVEKLQSETDTVSNIRLLDSTEQTVELARMLAGQPESGTAKEHARELLEDAQAAKLVP